MPIECDGRRIDVTANLNDALRYMRKPEGRFVLWVDALCINQDDLDERNAQVRLMGQIYGRAQEVLVWLVDAVEPVHDDEPGTAEAFETLEKLATGYKNGTPIPYLFQFDVANIRSYHALTELLNWSWFNRTWIVQEVALAQVAHIVCGEHRIPWSDFHMAMRHMIENGQDRLVNYESARVLTLGSLQNNSRGLMALLNHFRGSDAKDPRDHIFGFLGIADCRGVLQADYSKSVTEFYIEATQALINDEQSLEVLSAVQTPDKRTCLPSWVPDWREKWSIDPLGMRGPDNKSMFRASANLKLVSKDHDDPEKLVIGGFRFDKVEYIQHFQYEWTHLRDEESRIIKEMRPLREHISSKRSYLIGREDYESALQETMVAERGPDSKRARLHSTFYG